MCDCQRPAKTSDRVHTSLCIRGKGAAAKNTEMLTAVRENSVGNRGRAWSNNEWVWSARR